MHNSMCCRKLTCLLCECDRDFQLDYHRRTGKKTKVSYNKTQFQNVNIWSTGRGNGATGVHQAFLDGYQGESIEHSLMDPEREEGAQNAQQCVRQETHTLALRLPVGESIEHSLKRTENLNFKGKITY